VRSCLLALLLATLVAASLLAGAPAGALPPRPPNAAQSERALERIAVAVPGSLAGYVRKKFGSWRATGQHCDVRERVVVRDGRGVSVDEACESVVGSWISFYDGERIRDASELDIDHVVPLANAWRSGARDWSPERRRQFANDLVDPQLIAVSASSNRSKGDSAPEEWKPPRRAAWCLYARWWIDVKTVWRLTVTREENTALGAMLTTC
jgi:hypothetical protein